MIRRSRTAALTGALAAVGLLISGCTVPRPSVTFYGNRTSVAVQAYQWCGQNLASCSLDKSKVGSITMAAGQPLQVSVAPEIASTIWRVIWVFQDSKKKVTTGASPYFTDNRLTFRIPSFGTGVILQTVEVQSLIAGTDAAGALGFAVTSSWDLIVVPKTASTTSP